ncbi:hypothetical protein G6O69_37790 [Pseudenhygromyxa sp. WMMC2535]|uniref:hypothetical protein n=1 Tax=Pseudenhygromyxa sp. WMMC2535 TaxID=2712867 RepID=UPI00159562B6|nr:hypothetical protein [Pseudenhygromyxa sp. WMMC2535]NVB43624.1 hypothetical protein [Pseudenhygromyxa sp. WMMC2535]
MTFSEPVTQVGLTAGKNGTQYLTVWDENGDILGQVTWVPNSDSAFIGLDTNGVPIGMVTYGNDDVWSGVTYGIGGATIMSDTWIWALGTQCEVDSDCEDDGNACTDNLCEAGQCVYPTNENPCDDGDACTDVDTCIDGECVGTSIDCDDMNVCSQDACDTELGCVYEFTEGCCASDEDCLEGEICDLEANACIPDPDPGDTTDTGEDTGEDTESDTDDSGTEESSSDDGSTSSEDSGDTDDTSDSGGESGGDSSSEGSGDDDDVGEDTFGGSLDTFGNDEGGEDGCSCAAQGRRGDGLLGLFGLALLGLLRRRRDD